MPINSDRILFQDDSFLAVHKLSGELVVKGAGKVDKLPLLDFLRKEYPGLRTLQRLDFETSGVVLFARTKEAFERAVPTHQREEDVPWTKTYRALVAGRVKSDQGEISTPLPARSGKGMLRQAQHRLVPALTRYRVLERFVNSTYVEAQIETGRHHQIRRHFAKIGHPLCADLVYGDRKFNRIFIQELHYKKFFLHAFSLEFIHPLTKEKTRIEAPMPKSFEVVLKKLRDATN
ncbi:MAG: RluA family pseudouridine synthase [Candidatus Peribacteraceae bacterium]